MPGLQGLPVELLLNIFELSSLNVFELTRLRTVSAKWREILDSWKIPRERLFLQYPRPSSSIPPSHGSIRLDVRVLIRRVPSTIWNDYATDLYEMKWQLIPGLYQSKKILKSLNPVLRHISHWMHLVCPHFTHAERADSSYGTPKPPLSLCFRTVQELESLVALRTDHNGTESWRKMLVSSVPMRHLGVVWSVSIRDCTEKFEHTIITHFNVRINPDSRMDAVIKLFQTMLRVTPRFFKGNGQTDIMFSDEQDWLETLHAISM
jgi:hypothetical protein